MKISMRDRLLRSKFLTGWLLFCQPPLGCFLNVGFLTLLAALLKIFFAPTTSATSGTAKSSKSGPTRFAARAIYSLKKRMANLPINCASVPKPRPVWRPKILWKRSSRLFDANILNTNFKTNECRKTFLNMRTSLVIPTEAKGISSADVSCKSICMLWKEFLNNRLNWRFVNVW